MRSATPSVCLLVVLLAGCTGKILVQDGTNGAPPSLVDAGPGGDHDAGPPPPPGTDAGRRPPPAPGTDAGRPPSPPPDDMCGDERTAGAVYHGTREPTYLPLSPNQILAIGDFGYCSGLLIAPTWVLTADHCNHRVGARFCMGTDPADADVCFEARAVHDAPGGGDMTLLRIDDVRPRLPDVVPIPILTEDLSSSWVGRTAEASGYGRQETGRSGEREFTAEPIVSIAGDDITIDGEGRRGVCFGDSGGPVMVIATDGTVRVAGALSNGDTSCVGRDNYTRVDRYRDWIVGLTGPPEVDGASCGEVTTEGRCMSGTALFCRDDELVSERCSGSCGWDATAGGFRCIEGADPCEGLDRVGECAGNVARWCDRGELRERDCGACAETCGNVAEFGGYYCAPDPCMGIDYHGRCEGDVVQYCKDGELRTRDCAREGQSCGWVNDELGYWCS